MHCGSSAPAASPAVATVAASHHSGSRSFAAAPRATAAARVPVEGLAERILSRRRPVLRFQPVASLAVPPARAARGAYGVRLAYRLQRSQPAGLVAATLRQHGFAETQGADFNVLWAGQHLRPEQLGALAKVQRVNHFPRSGELTRKDRLHVNVQRMARQKGARHYAFVPKSFLLPAEWSAFRAAWRACRRPYIVKPAASSRGRGIYIVTHPSQVPLCVCGG